MKNYVLGFLFSSGRGRVALIRKNKPQWQAGLLNGIGGKIEDTDESPEFALSREFKEEAGANIHPGEWEPFCKMHGDDFTVYCFKFFSDLAFESLRTCTDELVVERQVHALNYFECVSNLSWLIPMALDNNYGQPFLASINYNPLQGLSDALKKEI